MKLNGLWMAAAALVLSASVSARVVAGLAPMSGPEHQPRTVLTETDAFVLLPPELIAAPVVSRVLFSGTGRYVLVERTSVKITAELIRGVQAGREPPAGEVSLVVGDNHERTAREVWKAPLAGTSVSQIAWLPQSEVAFALVRESHGTESRQALLRISGPPAQTQAIPLVDPSGSAIYSLQVSPTRPLAILQQTAMISRVRARPDGTREEVVQPQESFTLLERGGPPGRKLTLPDEMRLRSFEWDEDGNAVLGLFQVGPAKIAPNDRWFALDPQTASLRPLPMPPPLYASKLLTGGPLSSSVSLRVRLTTPVIKEGETSQNLGLLWLESVGKSEKPRALVSGDSTGGQLLPGGEGVLYFSQGAVWVAPLLRLTRAEHQAMVDSARRAAAMSRAKQIGLGLSMYAQDYDGAFPSAAEMGSRLAPYLKQDNLVDGFVFTFLGGKETDIQNPSETELGYISTAGGRAVLYADGHVALKKE